MEKSYVKALTIAGSDSGGGAGIQADLKTFSALGCFGMSAVTALTAQNTLGVSGIHPVPPDFVAAQIAAVFTDMGADAVKIGMLFSVELIEAVAEALKAHGAKRVALDPVMVAQSGDKLLQDDAVEAIKTHLMPLADVVTPNLPEAAVLLGRESIGPDGIREAARAIAAFGSRTVLLKGGHFTGTDSEDLLYLAGEDRFLVLRGGRIDTPNTHGTGCTLSAAIAARLAQGDDIPEAAFAAKDYITGAIRAGADRRLGRGRGPVHHFFRFWE